MPTRTWGLTVVIFLLLKAKKKTACILEPGIHSENKRCETEKRVFSYGLIMSHLHGADDSPYRN